MGSVCACSPSWNAFVFLLKRPFRPCLEGDAGGLGEGKGTSLGSWKFERLGCRSKTAVRTLFEGCLSSTGLSKSCAGVSGRLRALLILDHMLVVVAVVVVGVGRGVCVL